MTTYGNYQFEPIWYLRIVSKDNKYGAWVKLYNSTKKANILLKRLTIMIILFLILMVAILNQRY